ncbi:MAG: hypothetical protein Q7J56_02675 [Deltaproteobacteria bacterium]|nr:hypothetical protein [Deltaproteobacteria bacterium]
MDKKKGILALIGIGALVAVVVALNKEQAGADGGGGGGDNSISLVIIPAGMARVGEGFGAITPVTLQANSVGNTAQVTITNNTVYIGTTVQAPYTFNVKVSITVHTNAPDIPVLVLNIDEQVSFAPGETKPLSWSFSVPVNAASPWAALARMLTTDKATLVNSATATGTVQGLGVTPGGTISF